MTETVSVPPLGLSSELWARTPLFLKALTVAKAEFLGGTCEMPKGTDRGPRVDAILRSANGSPGSPWSAAFVSWCYKWAGWDCFPAIKYPCSVMSWVAWADQTKRLSHGFPERGDIYYIDRPGRCLIGFVIAVRDGMIRCVEGDSDDKGGDGWQVIEKDRPVSEPTGFIRLRNLA